MCIYIYREREGENIYIYMYNRTETLSRQLSGLGKPTSPLEALSFAEPHRSAHWEEADAWQSGMPGPRTALESLGFRV